MTANVYAFAENVHISVKVNTPST